MTDFKLFLSNFSIFQLIQHGKKHNKNQITSHKPQAVFWKRVGMRDRARRCALIREIFWCDWLYNGYGRVKSALFLRLSYAN